MKDSIYFPISYDEYRRGRKKTYMVKFFQKVLQMYGEKYTNVEIIEYSNYCFDYSIVKARCIDHNLYFQKSVGQFFSFIVPPCDECFKAKIEDQREQERLIDIKNLIMEKGLDEVLRLIKTID